MSCSHVADGVTERTETLGKAPNVLRRIALQWPHWQWLTTLDPRVVLLCGRRKNGVLNQPSASPRRRAMSDVAWLRGVSLADPTRPWPARRYPAACISSRRESRDRPGNRPDPARRLTAGDGVMTKYTRNCGHNVPMRLRLLLRMDRWMMPIVDTPAPDLATQRWRYWQARRSNGAAADTEPRTGTKFVRERIIRFLAVIAAIEVILTTNRGAQAGGSTKSPTRQA